MWNLAVVIFIDLREWTPLGGEIVECEDCGNRAHRYAGATIDALLRIYIELRSLSKLALVLPGMDAIHRASIYASGILHANTGFCDDISHSFFSGAARNPHPRGMGASFNLRIAPLRRLWR